MGSLKKKQLSVQDEIVAIVNRYLGKSDRLVSLIRDTDSDGNDATRIEIDIEAKETHDADRLAKLRHELMTLFLQSKELINPNLVFRAKIRATITGKGTFGDDPEVQKIRKMIESLSR